jgi:hypothetical protein
MIHRALSGEWGSWRVNNSYTECRFIDWLRLFALEVCDLEEVQRSLELD